MEGMGAHSHNFFGKWEILVTRKKVDFRRNFGIFFCENGPRYRCQNFIPDGPWGPRLAHSKNWPHPLRFLKNLGKTFLGVVRPGGPGAKI